MAGRHRRVRSSAPPRHRQPPPRGHVALPALAAAAVLGIGGVGASAALSGGGGAHPDSAPPITHVLPSVTSTSTVPAVASAPSAAATPTARPRPDFSITVTGRACWIEVLGPHRRVLVARIVRHGHTISYPQRPLLVTLGDAGAVRLVLRGHARAHAGRPGQVLRFTVR